MLFNSFEFLIFLPVVYGLFRHLQSQTHRLILFFFASCFFYSFLIPAYLLILFVLIGVDYWAGIKIEDTPHPARKRLFLMASVAANLGILGFFKYTNFLIENLQTVATALHWNLPLRALEIILPIGLSFHTFQSLSYVFEVYAGRLKLNGACSTTQSMCCIFRSSWQGRSSARKTSCLNCIKRPVSIPTGSRAG